MSDLYINNVTGDDGDDGSAAHPWKTFEGGVANFFTGLTAGTYADASTLHIVGTGTSYTFTGASIAVSAGKSWTIEGSTYAGLYPKIEIDSANVVLADNTGSYSTVSRNVRQLWFSLSNAIINNAPYIISAYNPIVFRNCIFETDENVNVLSFSYPASALPEDSGWTITEQASNFTKSIVAGKLTVAAWPAGGGVDGYTIWQKSTGDIDFADSITLTVNCMADGNYSQCWAFTLTDKNSKYAQVYVGANGVWCNGTWYAVAQSAETHTYGITITNTDITVTRDSIPIITETTTAGGTANTIVMRFGEDNGSTVHGELDYLEITRTGRPIGLYFNYQSTNHSSFVDHCKFIGFYKGVDAYDSVLATGALCVTNSIIENCLNGIVIDKITLTTAYNDFYNNGVDIATQAVAATDIDSDPDQNADHTLQATSPCIGTGTGGSYIGAYGNVDYTPVILYHNNYIYLDWEDVSGATKYECQVSAYSDFSILESSDDNLSLSEYNFTNTATSPLKLYWKFRSYTTSWSNWSSIRSVYVDTSLSGSVAITDETWKMIDRDTYTDTYELNIYPEYTIGHEKPNVEYMRNLNGDLLSEYYGVKDTIAWNYSGGCYCTKTQHDEFQRFTGKSSEIFIAASIYEDTDYCTNIWLVTLSDNMLALSELMGTREDLYTGSLTFSEC